MLEIIDFKIHKNILATFRSLQKFTRVTIVPLNQSFHFPSQLFYYLLYDYRRPADISLRYIDINR
jgi:hypothetical protein